jgi:pantetheine-phosphate adenylyltransferase
MTMASMNKKLAPEFETMMMFAAPEYYYISSRGVKEVAMNGGALKGLVPDNVIEPLRMKLQKQ